MKQLDQRSPTTKEEILAVSLSDPDNPPLTEAELSSMKPVPRSKWIRRRLGLTQEQFAERFQVPLGTLRDWEQHRTEPDAPAKAYLAAISGAPDLVLEALRRDEEQQRAALQDREELRRLLQEPR